MKCLLYSLIILSGLQLLTGPDELADFHINSSAKIVVLTGQTLYPTLETEKGVASETRRIVAVNVLSIPTTPYNSVSLVSLARQLEIKVQNQYYTPLGRVVLTA